MARDGTRGVSVEAAAVADLDDRKLAVPRPELGWGSVVAPVVDLGSAPSGAERIAALDVQRSLAVLAVVVFNVYQFCNVNGDLYRGSAARAFLSSLDAGVPWLFVVTGYLLFTPVVAGALLGEPAVPARVFLARRAARIVPLYYVVVVLVWVARQQTLPGDWRDLVEHVTFTQVFDAKRIFYTDGPAWAVSVLVLVCLVFAVLGPGVRQVCCRLATRRHRVVVLAVSCVAVAAVSTAWKACAFGLMHRPPTGSPTTWYGPLASFDSVAIGMGLAVLVTGAGGSLLMRPRHRWLLWLGAAAILAGAFVSRSAGGWASAFFTTECSVGFALLVAAAVVDHQHVSVPPARRFWLSRLLAELGTASYGIYLWHEPILLAFANWHGVVRQTPGAFGPDVVVVIVVSVAAGWLSQRIIQRPTERIATFLQDQSLQHVSVTRTTLT